MATETPLHIVTIMSKGETVFVAKLYPGKDGGTVIDTSQVTDAINPALAFTGVLAVALLAPPEISVKLLSCCSQLSAWLEDNYPGMLEVQY